MHFSFHPKGNWSLLNEKATEVFGVNEARNQVRVYNNAAAAILESALGFFQQFPLKKKFFYFKNLDPHFDLAITALSKMGLQGRALEIADMTKPDVWQNELDREAGVFLYAYDNPVTGIAYVTQELTKVLKEKNIFRITLSHALHFVTDAGREVLAPSEIDRNEILVRPMPSWLAHGVALSYVGERGRFGAITAEASSPCSLEEIANLKTQVLALASQVSEATKKITDYEKSLGEDFKLLDPSAAASSSGTQNRIIIIFDDIDGFGFLSELAKLEGSGGELKLAGLDSRFETASLTRWGGLKTMDWLTAHELEANQVRGLVVLYPDYFLKLSPSEFKDRLLKAKAQTLRLQYGDINTDPSGENKS